MPSFIRIVDAIKESEKRAKADAEEAAKQAQLQQPEYKNYFVTFYCEENPEETKFIELNCQPEFLAWVKKNTNTDVVPLCDANLTDYNNFIDTHPLADFESVFFCNGKPSQMEYTIVFDDVNFQMNYYKI